jgi:hypothetical protein
MAFHVRWARAGEASITSIAGDAIVLRSTVSSPPGSRIEGTVAGERPVSLRVKVHACRRQPEGDFVLEARLLDTTREVRQRLEAVAEAGSPD